MKRILTLSLLVALCASAIWAASGKAGKNVRWELSDGVLTISGTGPMKNYGKDRPFREDRVTKLIVEEGVTTISNNLCRDCANLIVAELPGSLTHIGENAFLNCENLSEIRIPFGTETIAQSAFQNCKTFIEIELPISIKAIGQNALAGCENMTTARLSQSIEAIGKDSFKGCKLLAELTDLPAYVTTSTFAEYGLNRAAVKKHWDRKEELAAKYGNASGSDIQTKSVASTAKVEPSDVDLNIPFTGKTNNNTFAVIIANENYGKLSNVPFALNDGNTFALYCKRTLGIPEKNILQFNDATYGAMKAAFSDLRLINDVVGEDMKVIVYYAGHGAPDDATLDPYLVPVDAARVNKDVCVPLASIYRDLGSMKLRSATVFLDACFSGATRDGSMVVAARGIARVPKKQGLTGKVAVFCATSEDQTAMPYNEKGHGMFTYFLLKRLQETEGNVSLVDLKDYLNENVARHSTIVNRKDQTPTVLSSPAASAEWDSWKLID